ncbi:MAG: hypothetical protein MUE94_00510 [Verrucomicrobia bacterium]|nr:hypothetical protein [Verrucomicrobiota bacterium]
MNQSSASIPPVSVLVRLTAPRQMLVLALLWAVGLGPSSSPAQTSESFVEGPLRATISAREEGGVRKYTLTSNAELRDNTPPDKTLTFAETPGHARLRTGNLLFDGLYALAVHEAVQNSVSEIKDGAYGRGAPTPLEAFQTGEFWTYVWTRDLSYSAHLALGGFDPERAVNSLLFKSSRLKASVPGGFPNQMVQDTGSGGSYPVSSDRIVWILGASETLKFLPEARRAEFLQQVYPILRDTLEHDRRVIFDPQDGLYRGEQSFLDWREQTYPGWTKDNVLAIAASKALSVNAAYAFALQTASEYAGRLDRREEQARYAGWARALRTAINRHLYDPQAGLYSTCLFADPAHAIRTHRYDLLGESLAILLGVADDQQAASILGRYPCGPFGPPVVWPQERTVPIYHNQAIWPFVTAYWTKAGRRIGSADVVDQGIRSLMRGAAFNLSNMENFDLVTGRAQVSNGLLSGPVINSRRQLWSVAGYLAMVQDVVFGLETSWDGIRFLPCVTARLRNETFGTSQQVEFDNFTYQGKQLQVRVHLPPAGMKGRAPCRIARIKLNGKLIGTDFVASASLPTRSTWDIELESPSESAHAGSVVPAAMVADLPSIYGPLQPEWDDTGAGALRPVNGRLELRFLARGPNLSTFNIYRNGRLCAARVETNVWVDLQSSDYDRVAHFYAVEAIDGATGAASHLTPARFCATTNNQWIIPATALEHQGGILTEGRYFRDWGAAEHTLQASRFTAVRSGNHLVRVEFANGAGPVNTGITCGVKKLEVRDADSGTVVGSGYLVMPQSGDWRRFELSSAVPARLKAGRTYALRIFEDDCARNMSCLAGNERYTAHPGGGPAAYNFVNIASLRVIRVAD